MELKQVNVQLENTAISSPKKRTENARLTAGSGPKITNDVGKIGGEFELQANPAFLSSRAAIYDEIMGRQKELLASLPRIPIQITLPDGTVKEGISWETTPLEIATNISKGLASACVVAKVLYTESVDDPLAVSAADVDGNETNDDDGGCCGTIVKKYELWDLTRPLIGSCKLQLLKFEDREGQMVFWHSSAHVLGECLECQKGAHLTIGPPVEGGFYYDSYMGEHSVLETEFSSLEKASQQIVKQKQAFERIVLTKEEALSLFADNPFKKAIISSKIPDGGRTTAYRCGPLIDLCRGPHIPTTGAIKAFAVTRTSSAYWLGKVGNDSLQRVYGISFPDKKMMKEWKVFQAEAAKRDHRKLGLTHELFFFHALSPGCAFWLPHGARMFNTLLRFMQTQYRRHGYDEVMTPNIFNMDLWHTSGHALHYQDNMFSFEVENAQFALKPMNCPSHCLMFSHRMRSYRELPLRWADFGVLHRNELSGALSGMTRVRRFQQDDAHIFCRKDQIKQEIVNFLKLMDEAYSIFGLKYTLELSTKPAKALGSDELWVEAESSLSDALDAFAGAGNWRENPGDGAFYGPKIDIKTKDALNRIHQCATVQLDFQLPIRFDLKYRSDTEAQFERPVIIHRAVYGSIERFTAILTEHYAGKFPFWLSPRQILVISVGADFTSYGHEVRDYFYRAGFHVEFDDSAKTLNKKIREGQMAQYNFILVVGAKEKETQSVNIRTRDNVVHGTKTLQEALDMFEQLQKDKTKDEDIVPAKKE